MNKIELVTYNLLKKLLVEVKDYSSTDPHRALSEAETIVSCLATLTDPLLELEQEYRELVVLHIDDGKSKAESEARAKASNEYRRWQKMKMMYELGDEHVKILKKFKDVLEAEYMRS